MAAAVLIIWRVIAITWNFAKWWENETSWIGQWLAGVLSDENEKFGY